MKKLLVLCSVFLIFSCPTFELDLKMNEISLFKYMKFSEKNLYDYIHALGFKDPIFVFKQSINESGWWEGNLYKQTNNLFSMHKAERRETTADYWILADQGKFCGYSHWTKSVNDLKLYENWIQKSYPTIPYQQAIKLAGYCPNNQYVKWVNNINYDFSKLN